MTELAALVTVLHCGEAEAAATVKFARQVSVNVKRSAGYWHGLWVIVTVLVPPASMLSGE
ncbi:MAG: hypothetical protein MZV64_24400 [Ignavibacteriales bacterium]|nr:hypothetical protein [Ignavibacteriales bacterium]